jgi:hypothetical protein
LSILAERGEKTRVLFPRELNQAQLGEHDRPAEDRSDRKQQQDELAGNRGVLKSKEQTAGGQ